MRRKSHILIIVMLISMFFSCQRDQADQYAFNLEPGYTSIKSYPGGMGIFVLRLKNQHESHEGVTLQLKCDPGLNATLTKSFVTEDQQTFEVQIKPQNDMTLGEYPIEVIGQRKEQFSTVSLEVKVMNWSNTMGLSEKAADKLKGFIQWMNKEYPNITINEQTHWDVYTTYPQIIIVEHCTLLSDRYEMRICCHMMIPPDDWAMIRVRERNSFTPFLAAKQDATGASIYVIPVTDYPELFGY